MNINGHQGERKLHTQISRDAYGNKIQINAKLTAYVLFNGIVAGACGLTLGLDNGLTGGVEDMDEFLRRFYPTIAGAKESDIKPANPYCLFNNPLLELFTSIAYIGGMSGAPFASYFTQKKGRKWSVIMCGWTFLLGAALQASAMTIAQLFIGRFILGFGVGIGISAGPMFLSEVAPPHIRGAFNLINEWCITGGILLAQLINLGTSKYDHGFRVSLGLQGVPALLLAFGGFFILESPNSLIERGHLNEGKQNLQKLRGVQDVENEYQDILKAAERGSKIKNPWKALFLVPNLPPTIISWMLPLFQNFTGINVIMFYSPQILTTLGLSSQGALKATIILGLVNFLATAVSVIFVDRMGRKALYLEGGIQMFISQVIYAVVMGKFFKTGFNSGKVQKVLVFLSCVFVAGYSWSWGALPFLTPSEFLKLELRPAGLAFNTISNFLWTFVIGQCFLSMFCRMKYGVYLFFAGMVVIMTFFIQFLTPESKNIPLEDVHEMFKKHWFWKICYKDDYEGDDRHVEMGKNFRTQDSSIPLEGQYSDSSQRSLGALGSMKEEANEDSSFVPNGNGHVSNGHNQASNGHVFKGLGKKGYEKF